MEAKAVKRTRLNVIKSFLWWSFNNILELSFHFVVITIKNPDERPSRHLTKFRKPDFNKLTRIHRKYGFFQVNFFPLIYDSKFLWILKLITINVTYFPGFVWRIATKTYKQKLYVFGWFLTFLRFNHMAYPVTSKISSVCGVL